jgi:tripartite ATP-independent transporter DctP family solute receptor
MRSGHRTGLVAGIALFLLAIAVHGLASQAGQAQAQVIRLRLAELHPDDHPTTKADYEFARLVSERSGGRIKIAVFSGSALGQEISVLEQLQFGAIDIARVSLTAVASYVPSLAALEMPYLYKDEAQMWRVLRSGVGRELLASVKGAGFVGLCFFEAGARSFYNSKRPVRRPSDLVGLKVRVQESKLMADTVAAFGATPIPLAFGEAYSALETGLVDGAENNLPTYLTSLHYKVAGFYTLTRHSRIPEMLVGSQESLATLSPADLAIVEKAAEDVVEFQREAWRAYERDSAATVARSGISFVEPADPGAWKALAASVYERQPREIRAIVERIKDVK